MFLLGCLTLEAAPVDVSEAQALAGQFVKTSFEFAQQSDELALVYSQPAFYVFNVGDHGFVIMSADDRFRPVIGYSYQGAFKPDDMAPALQDYLDGINEYRMNRNAVGDADAAQNWMSLRNYGRLVTRYGGKDGSYLVQTQWNQNYPYNYCCPVASDGPGGHVYAGCVATAGAQLMKYWNYPIQGTGSYSYYPEDHPEYGPLTANFGETVYDWDNMPNTISASSPIEKIQAVGQLIYHVGVSVDMNYRPSGSGASTVKLCTVMPQYFFYTEQMDNIYREDHTHDSYMALITEAIDMSWPMAHRGGGHAYVLDGYDDKGFVHFNWGWSGSNDGFFDIDDHGYTDGESVIYNYVPAPIYSATPASPTNLSAVPSTNDELSATITWNNPSLTLTNQPLTAIDRIVVMRDSDIIYTEDNVTPGAAMSIVDNSVPMFSSYTYKVYAITDGQRGRSTSISGIHVGPTCQWKFVVSASNMMGWRGARIAVYDYADAEVASVTINNSTPASLNVDIPLGIMRMAWIPSDNITSDYAITINVKDANNTSVYSYSGNILAMEEGVFYQGNNGCGMTPDCGIPSNLTAEQDPDDEHAFFLHWEGVNDPGYGYLIFRDDKAVCMTSETVYHDENLPTGGHCYSVSTFCQGGMSGNFSNMICVASGPCYPPRNFNFETTNNFRCKLTWDRPMPDTGLSGYIIYRKKGDEEYKRIKMVGANATNMTDNTLNEEGDYYYKLVAHYVDLECDSPPAAYIYDENQYYIHFYYSVDGVVESSANSLNVYPNPTKGMLNVEAPMMKNIEVYNMLGQKVFATNVNGDTASIDIKELGSGMFMIKVETVEGFMTKKVSIIE